MVARQIQILSGALLYYGLVLPLSYFPMGILYSLSNILFFLFTRILPYRKKVIDENIKRAFPKLDASEIIKFRKDFYRYFSDLLVESIKNLSISKRELLQRMQLVNPEILEEIRGLNKPILLVAGHYNNWEWLITAQALWFKQPNYGIGMPLSHPFWNQKLTQRRERFGLKVVHAQNYQKAFDAKQPVVLVLADQAPSSANNCLWLPFLGRETPVIFGPEYMANKYDCAVVFANISNSKRGFYNIQLELIVEESKILPYQELTQLHVKKLEQQILDNPARWLWSHKRWKHQQPSNWPEIQQQLKAQFEGKFRSHV
jgi:KDO2-lipid IV(A) lauroyltransferase